ncbi:hypothetical protein BDBG_16997 [Blastomyces gilchristii SLH14081]|uniref:Uncharacterized protein n=1 Tax=Blastomyces gilchristii (strain SLH14081) TaxID=559298 RepID=A0A179UM95_BLAGS|nr:uncharacterized protein BDBG_16997 [Blastomyces gilchristii SLH14081]OAT08348.1 hypothetical protein BDBG_16997 [Blastomyces gilchristii SLH14081]
MVFGFVDPDSAEDGSHGDPNGEAARTNIMSITNYPHNLWRQRRQPRQQVGRLMDTLFDVKPGAYRHRSRAGKGLQGHGNPCQKRKATTQHEAHFRILHLSILVPLVALLLLESSRVHLHKKIRNSTSGQYIGLIEVPTLTSSLHLTPQSTKVTKDAVPVGALSMTGVEIAAGKRVSCPERKCFHFSLL